MLAKELDGLPLALATAGAYLNQVTISVQDYLRLYQTSWRQLQRTSPSLVSYDRMLYSTWNISLDNIQQRNQISANLLRLWAYFDNQDIWFELLCYSGSDDPEWMYELTKDEISFHSAVRGLCDYGIVEAHSRSDGLDSKGYSVHSCVHAWTIAVLNDEWDRNLARFALQCVASHVPEPDSDGWWLIERRLTMHAAKCLLLMAKDPSLGDGIEWALHYLGLLYSNQGKLEQAEEMFLRALEGKEKALGAEHTSTLDTVNNLGALYRDQGKLEQAEEMCTRALEGCEKALGAEHTSTLGTVNNLGNLYRDQGKLEQAEEMYIRALEGKEKALGAEHTSTLDTVNNLGNLYSDQGKLGQAEEVYIRALEGYEKTLGGGAHVDARYC